MFSSGPGGDLAIKKNPHNPPQPLKILDTATLKMSKVVVSALAIVQMGMEA